MSLMATEWAWAQPVEGTSKLVLLCLADHADAEGRCWPAVPRIAERCGISARTARRALQVLRAGGALEVDERPGRVPVYRLLVTTVLRPIGLGGSGKAAQRVLPLVVPLRGGADPGQNDRGQIGRGAKLSPHPGHGGRTPLTNCHPTPVTLSTEPTSEPSREPSREAGRARGARIPDDWFPDLAGVEFAMARGVALEAQVEAFRSYWQGQAGARARSPDWSARWRTWCIKDQEFRTGRSQRVLGRADRADRVDFLLNMRRGG
jgi:DNA-binding transcriptional ArsR family regulator